MTFKNRREAGARLADRLGSYKGMPNSVVLALPRGGVPVAFEVARRLQVPLDVFVVRKVGAPGQEELAIGAVASGGIAVENPDVIRELQIPRETWQIVVKQKCQEVKAREHLFRGDRLPLALKGKKVILVDDGLATGATMRAAVTAIKQQSVSELVVAVPVGSRQACDEINALVDQLVCLEIPSPFYAVGQWYDDFRQTEDAEVQRLLADVAPPVVD